MSDATAGCSDPDPQTIDRLRLADDKHGRVVLHRPPLGLDGR